MKINGLDFELGAQIDILGEKLRVLGMASYSAGGHDYYKIFLDNHRILLPNGDGYSFVFGRLIDPVPYSEPFPDKINYDDEEYILNLHEHQKLNEIIFGDRNQIEGDCEFWDYENENGKMKSISVAILSDKTRADVIAETIDYADGKFVK